MRNLLVYIFLLYISFAQAQDSLKVYKFKIHEEIDAPAWRTTKVAFQQANDIKADYILLHLNTYGGRVDFADSIRSQILNSNIPVLVYIENNAASAGALISIACDSIYMSPGSTIGAATVVDQNGTPAPEKYQSYFRSKMRATAIEKGRNPDIAEAMVDPKIIVDSISDEFTLITFTVDEAIKNNYCEGRANSPEEAVKNALGNQPHKIIPHTISSVEAIVQFLINPGVVSILIIMIIGGIYLEVQAPGIGLPSIIAVIGAVLFFAPHYLHGLANNWEIILFFIGLVLIALEIFVIPGFGVAGISGIICVICGLAFSLIGVAPSESGVPLPDFSGAAFAFALVLGSLTLGIVGGIFLGGKILSNNTGFGSSIALNKGLTEDHIQLKKDLDFKSMIDKIGIAQTNLMPSGKILIDNQQFDALAQTGYIEAKQTIKVIGSSNSQLIVIIHQEENV